MSSLDLEFELPEMERLPFLQDMKLFKRWFLESITSYLPSRHIPKHIRRSRDYIEYMTRRIQKQEIIKFSDKLSCPNCANNEIGMSLVRIQDNCCICPHCKHKFQLKAIGTNEISRVSEENLYLVPTYLSTSELKSLELKDLMKQLIIMK